MFTLVTYTLFTLSIVFSSLYPSIIVLRAYLAKFVGKVFSEEGGLAKSLSVVIPSKGEPIDMVIKNVRRLSSLPCVEEILIVLDDPIVYVNEIVGGVGEEFFSRGVIVARLNGLGGRSGALTDGAKFSLNQNIFIMDVDTFPSPNLLCSAKMCPDVCVSVWKPYVEIGTRIEEAMAYITGFGSWVYYELKSTLNLFVYPLGAGTVIDKELLKSIGYWRVDVIQDDIWLGYELLYRGVKPKVLKGWIEVGVPKTLSAARIQQCRWGYGALNVFSRFIGKALKSPISFWEKLDAIVYTLQPIASILALTSFVLAVIASIVDNNVVFNFLYVIPIALAMLIQGVAISFYGRKVLGLKPWRILYLSGRTGALYTILSPLLGFYALKGLARMRYRYIVTPKTLQNRRTLDVSEVISLAFSIPTLITSTISRNSLTLLISLLLMVATVYSVIRFEKK